MSAWMAQQVLDLRPDGNRAVIPDPRVALHLVDACLILLRDGPDHIGCEVATAGGSVVFGHAGSISSNGRILVRSTAVRDFKREVVVSVPEVTAGGVSAGNAGAAAL